MQNNSENVNSSKKSNYILNWIKTQDSLPDECRPILGMVNVDGLFCIVQMTLVGGSWVTDASVAEVYGCEAHSELHDDYIPIKWAYCEAK